MGKIHLTKENQEQAIKDTEVIEKTAQKEANKSTIKRASEGKIYVTSSYNNTIITLTNNKGQVLAWKSAGSVGFKGTKKSTSFAASKVAETMSGICKKIGLEKLNIFVSGIGAGRESSVRTFIGQGLNVVSIKDITPIPHNGCRPRKIRRV